jgi:hypothetical protein
MCLKGYDYYMSMNSVLFHVIAHTHKILHMMLNICFIKQLEK